MSSGNKLHCRKKGFWIVRERERQWKWAWGKEWAKAREWLHWESQQRFSKEVKGLRILLIFSLGLLTFTYLHVRMFSLIFQLGLWFMKQLIWICVLVTNCFKKENHTHNLVVLDDKPGVINLCFHWIFY